VAWSWILAPTRSPLVHHPIAGSHYLKHSLLHPNRAPSSRKQMPPCFVGQNRAPAALFCILAPTQPPSTHCPIAPPHHLKPSVCLPNRISSTRKRTPPTLRWPKLSPGGSVLEFGFNPAPPPLAHCPIPPHHLLLARCVAIIVVHSFRPHLVYRHIQSSKLTAFVSFPIYIGEKATSCASTRNHPRTHNPILSATNATHTPSLPSLLLKPHLPVSPTLPPPVLLYIPSSPQLLSNSRPFPSSRPSTA
jgi:hypothetical protein